MRWGGAFYDIGTRPYGRVITIGGVRFVFAQERAYTHLNGATLDYRDGRFLVASAQPHDWLAHEQRVDDRRQCFPAQSTPEETLD